MKRTRKITAAFLALIMALSVLTAAPFTVDAASNNTQEAAKSISTNTTYTDSLSVQGQEDYYKFTLSSASKVSINFKHSLIDSNSTYWKATLYNTNGDEFVYLSSTGKNTDLTSSNVGLPSGTYYIKIYHDYWTYQNINYSFKVKSSSQSAWETEENDSYATGDSISLNKTYYGSLAMQGDVDYYKFTLSSSSKISINLKHTYIDSNNTYWKVALYNMNGDELVYLSSTGKNTDLTSSNVGLPSGSYYIMIYHDYWTYQNIDYSFKVNSSSQSAWETEVNDSYATGDSISLDKTYYGSLAEQGDVDYYKFSLSSSKTVTFNFKHSYIDSNSTYWKISLCNTDGDELLYLSSTGKNKSLTSSKVTLSSGSYYIKIYHQWYYYQNIDYSFSVNKLTLSTPKISSIANTTSGVKISWGKVSNASGYYIYRATSSSGSYTKIATVKSGSTLSYTNKTSGTYKVSSGVSEPTKM